MLVRAKETGIINSSRVRAGMVFHYDLKEGELLPSFLAVVKDGTATPTVELPSSIAGKELEYPKTIHDHDPNHAVAKRGRK